MAPPAKGSEYYPAGSWPRTDQISVPLTLTFTVNLPMAGTTVALSQLVGCLFRVGGVNVKQSPSQVKFHGSN